MAYSPQQNGKSERMNRTLMDKVRTKLIQTNLPKEFWGEAILCSAYELNRCPTNANRGLTPSQKWYNKNKLSKLRVFGCQAWYVVLPRQNKPERRYKPAIMIGYCGRGYRLWDFENLEVMCARDVRFDETETNYIKITSIKGNDNPNLQKTQVRIIQNNEELEMRQKKEQILKKV